ncbi:MAG: hypothetical protein ABGZ23_12110 [Fuerstiella sp.]
MGHLIRTLEGKKDLERLEEAYVVLAQGYLSHRAGQRYDEPETEGVPSFEDLKTYVLRSEEKVPVGDLKERCDLIDTDEERPVELYNNLGQIEVLIAAIKILQNLGLEPEKAAPTQQSKDESGEDVSDLQGTGWNLEAFGGQKCTSNQKLFEDLCTLHESSELGNRHFLGFRRLAWDEAYKAKKLTTTERTFVGGTTKKRRARYGEKKVNVQAQLHLVGECDGICVCEAFDIICNPPLVETTTEQSQH